MVSAEMLDVQIFQLFSGELEELDTEHQESLMFDTFKVMRLVRDRASHLAPTSERLHTPWVSIFN